MKKSITSAAPLASWSRFSFFLATSSSKPQSVTAVQSIDGENLRPERKSPGTRQFRRRENA